MTYSREENELMISDLLHGRIQNLDEYFTPQRRHIKAKAWHLPFHIRARKIVISLIEYFQNNPINLKEDWSNSGIPFFVWDVRKFSEDKDVNRLMQIPNIKLIRSERMD